MKSIEELRKYVYSATLDYLADSGEKVGKIPLPIVDFVIEEFQNKCNFQEHHDEGKIVSVLEKKKQAMSQACVEVYGKIGGEGQISHSENGTSRTYESSWISPKLFDGLPNYVGVLF